MKFAAVFFVLALLIAVVSLTRRITDFCLEWFKLSSDSMYSDNDLYLVNYRYWSDRGRRSSERFQHTYNCTRNQGCRYHCTSRRLRFISSWRWCPRMFGTYFRWLRQPPIDEQRFTIVEPAWEKCVQKTKKISFMNNLVESIPFYDPHHHHHLQLKMFNNMKLK